MACSTAAAMMSTQCWAEETRTGLTWDIGGRVRTDYQRQVRHDEDKLTSFIEPEVKLTLPEGSTVFAKPSLALSPTGDFKAEFNDQSERSRSSRIHRYSDYSQAELKELYIDTTLAGGTLRLGKQQIVWGAADGIRVLDVVDPMDLNNFIMADPVDARIGLWSANYQKALPWADLQLIWSPDHTFNDYSAEPLWYQLTSPRIIPGGPPPNTFAALAPVDRPRGGLKNSEAGIRLTKVIGGADFTLNYLRHYNNDVVVYRYLSTTPIGPLLTYQPTYKATNLYGGTVSVAKGSIVYRGELAYNTDSYVLTRSADDRDGIAHLRELSGVVGVDWSGLTDTLVSAQFYQSRLLGQTSNLVRDAVDNTVTLNITRNFVNEIWRAELLLVHNLNDRDSAARARLKYSPTDRAAFRVEYGGYAGKPTGLYGEFHDRSRWLVGVDLFF